ncbi:MULTISPECIES: hypothetical protein [Pectobacterium]|uniref:hypothetical protein n=1 Tax=Pectobacterium TaxID=122277 RepID=UPI000ACA998E|nr:MULTISPECIES: hypothetical protein [Pectobacterium]
MIDIYNIFNGIMMNLKHFITEYDESLSSELSIDPLGQLIIWSSFGQQIFCNRISSVANDVRHYTLNLLHHYVIRSVLYGENTKLGAALQKKYDGKSDLKLKHACLIFLENIYTLSMCYSQGKSGVVTTGVLGIVKARDKFAKSDNNPQLIFGNDADSQLLTQQLFLGTNGRYKTPMMNMHFFDNKYNYHLSDGISAWKLAGDFILNTPHLKKLFYALCTYLRAQLSVLRQSELTIRFFDIDSKLTQSYVQSFRSVAFVGRYAKDFWLKMTRLQEGASGVLYDVLELESSNQKMAVEDIYQQALSRCHDADDRALLQHIVHVEPLLAGITLLFSGLLQHKKQTLENMCQFWAARGLDKDTLPKCADPVINDKTLLSVLSGTAYTRLEQLIKVAKASSVTEQITALLKYHESVMQGRGQLPWLTLSGETLTLQVPVRALRADRRNEDWVNDYYISQFRHMLQGLWGKDQ